MRVIAINNTVKRAKEMGATHFIEQYINSYGEQQISPIFPIRFLDDTLIYTSKLHTMKTTSIFLIKQKPILCL